jgi:hypothetical protein
MPASSRDAEIESQKALEQGGGERHRIDRRLMWIEYITPKKRKSKLRDRGARRPFQLDRDDR